MLTQLYEEYRRSGQSLPREFSSSFFAPLLVEPPTDWKGSKHRIAFVGQETLGWNWTQTDATKFGYSLHHPEVFSLTDFIVEKTAIPALLDCYKQFDFGSRQPLTYRSPFWTYFRRVEETNLLDNKPSMIFTNVIRCAADSEGGFTPWDISAEDRTRFLAWQNGLLSQELSVLDPTLVIFVSGPYYDDFLRQEFAGLKFEPVFGFEERQLAKLTSDALPCSAYRTYHPGYLSRSLGFAPIQTIMELSFR